MPVALSGTFLQFIGVCEALGGLGLILPGLLRIKPGLTPLAAVGLVIIVVRVAHAAAHCRARAGAASGSAKTSSSRA